MLNRALSVRWRSTQPPSIQPQKKDVRGKGTHQRRWEENSDPSDGDAFSVDLPRCSLRIVADDVSVPTSIEHGVIGPEARGNFLWNFQKANPGWRCVPTTRENEVWKRKKSEGRTPSWVSDKMLFERVVGPPFRRCKARNGRKIVECLFIGGA